MNAQTILLASPDDTLRRAAASALAEHPHRFLEARDPVETIRRVRRERPTLVVIGAPRHDTWNVLQLAREIRASTRTLPVVLIVEESTEDLAIEALRAGITDYFKMPLSTIEFAASIRNCLCPPAAPPASVRSSPAVETGGTWITGKTPAMRAIMSLIVKAAATDSNVLITGETGTGKELVARLIHRYSKRVQKPLVRINCAAIPDTLFESELFGYERGAFTGADTPHEGKLKHADGGTAFFDEVGDMTMLAQAKILRVIEDREVSRLGSHRTAPVDIRVSAATNQNLDRLMADGRFRADLYFRLNVVRIGLPPLRERSEDIPGLVQSFVAELNTKLGMHIDCVVSDAMDMLAAYHWPGNVRELRNVLEAAAVAVGTGPIARLDLPEYIRRATDAQAPDTTRGGSADEHDRLLSALWLTNWNKSQAARQLHCSRMTLYRRLAKYRVTRSNKRPA